MNRGTALLGAVAAATVVVCARAAIERLHIAADKLNFTIKRLHFMIPPLRSNRTLVWADIEVANIRVDRAAPQSSEDCGTADITSGRDGPRRHSSAIHLPVPATNIQR